MGNQHSIGQNDIVLQNNGQYIIPNKLNHPKTVQQEEIVNNIFGINDPTLLTRSYWAKEEDRSPFNNKDGKSPVKSRLYSEQVTKSIVTDFRVDQIITDPSQVRNLSKNTSYSIIQKLNKFDDENQSQSPFKNSQLNKTNDLRYSKYTKNKENLDYLFGSGKKNISQSKVKDNQKKNMERTLSGFKGTQRISQESSRRKVLDDVTLRSQISNIFGLENLQEEECGQLTDRLEEQLKSMRKTEVGGQKSRMTTQRSIKNQQSHQRSWNQPSKQQPYRGQNQFCEQTFSRFQEQNAYPAYLSKASEKESSQKNSQKTGSKKSIVQKYRGLNEDSHNESLMKVMKRITDLNLKIEDNDDKNSQQTIKINRPIIEDNSEIMNENWKNQTSQKHSVRSKNDLLSQKSSKKNYQKYQDRSSNFKFELKQVNYSQKSAKSKISKQSNNKISQQQYYESNQESESSQQQISSKSSYKNTNKNQISNKDYLAGTSSISNHYCLQNDIYQTQSSQGLDDAYSEKFHFPRNLSPRSLASQQRIITRQRSCSGRLIETSKASQKSHKETENSFKNFDFSKKNYQQDQERSVYSKKYQPEQSQKPSKHSTKDYQLLLKIQTLQQELKRLKTKEQLQKFQSRRYSPVKQQKMRIQRRQINDYGSENEQDIEIQESKFCINDVSSTKPLKRRSQYFKLKIK